MTGMHFPKVQTLLPILNTSGGYQMKTKFPIMSLASIPEGIPLNSKDILEVPFYRLIRKVATARA